jgi:hypothetical protein
MIGSPVFAWYITQAAFFLLIAVALWRRELSATAIAIFLVLWVLGFFAFAMGGYVRGGLFTGGGGMFAGYVAVLDIALVLAIFKGDVKIL